MSFPVFHLLGIWAEASDDTRRFLNLTGGWGPLDASLKLESPQPCQAQQQHLQQEEEEEDWVVGLESEGPRPPSVGNQAVHKRVNPDLYFPTPFSPVPRCRCLSVFLCSEASLSSLSCCMDLDVSLLPVSQEKPLALQQSLSCGARDSGQPTKALAAATGGGSVISCVSKKEESSRGSPRPPLPDITPLLLRQQQREAEWLEHLSPLPRQQQGPSSPKALIALVDGVLPEGLQKK